jgi:hypothetical protein
MYFPLCTLREHANAWLMEVVVQVVMKIIQIFHLWKQYVTEMKELSSGHIVSEINIGQAYGQQRAVVWKMNLVN